MTDKTIIKKCKEYEKITAEIEANELKKKQIQADFKKYLELNGVDEIDVGIYHFSNKATKPKKLFDTKAFAEKHPNLFKQFTTEGKPSKRFLFGYVKE